MKKIALFLNPIFIFVVIQLSWLGLLALWIYWYIDKHLLLKEIAKKYQPILLEKNASGTWLVLVEGGLLMLLILLGICIIFVYYIKIRNLNKLQNNFISAVTHELKSPLASIQLYLETMKYRDVPNKDKHIFLDYMLKDAERLSNLISNILKVNKFERRLIEYNFHSTNFKIFIEKFFDQQHIISDNLYKIEIEYDNGFNCMIDHETMNYAINNIVENAIKYTRQKLHLAIIISSDNKNCYVEFKDNGIGIEKKFQERIFKKFVRIGDEMKRTDQGTGIGLYLVKRIVTAHRGKIAVISSGKNQGTTFKIILPKAHPKAKPYSLERKEI